MVLQVQVADNRVGAERITGTNGRVLEPECAIDAQNAINAHPRPSDGGSAIHRNSTRQQQRIRRPSAGLACQDYALLFVILIRRPTRSACSSPAVLLILRTFLLSGPLSSDPPNFSFSNTLILLTLRARGEIYLSPPPYLAPVSCMSESLGHLDGPLFQIIWMFVTDFLPAKIHQQI